jgi:transketolase
MGEIENGTTTAEEGNQTLEQAAVNTLRVLACDAIASAGSGHGGIVLGAAPIMYATYKHMKFDPLDGAWFNRDRFVLSAGHGSALLYATLKCFGFNGIDLKTFRKYGSVLTGHPELNTDIGVDAATGPLGQGVAMAVGIALAEKKLAAKYNTKEHQIIDHRTFCLVGDGCLMEGVSYEAANLAGLWKLNKLVVIYDCNKITLDGTRESASAEDVKERFVAAKWNVVEVKRGNDEFAIASRIRRAMTAKTAPTLIIVNTQIGFGAKNAGTNKAHGQVLSLEEVTELRRFWDLEEENFKVDPDVEEHFVTIKRKKIGLARKWNKLLKEYGTHYPTKYEELIQFIDKPINDYECTAEGKTVSGRDSGYLCLNQIAAQNPRLVGGTADLSSTTKAFISRKRGDLEIFSHKKPKNDNIAYGVREFAMGAISNGLALHGYQPYCSTFLAFSDYLKPSIRLSALMNLPVTYIFTHDGLGNAPDGATHQGNEHLTSLRLIPNMQVFRPADDFEVAGVYEYVFEGQRPSSIILSRGNLQSPSGAGAVNEKPVAILLASGAEVNLCVRAQQVLAGLGVYVNVVSVPCIEQFDFSSVNRELPVVAVEMGSGMAFWAVFGKFGFRGDVVSFDDFGASGKDGDVSAAIGFTSGQVADRVLAFLERDKATRILKAERIVNKGERITDPIEILKETFKGKIDEIKNERKAENEQRVVRMQEAELTNVVDETDEPTEPVQQIKRPIRHIEPQVEVQAEVQVEAPQPEVVVESEPQVEQVENETETEPEVEQPQTEPETAPQSTDKPKVMDEVSFVKVKWDDEKADEWHKSKQGEVENAESGESENIEKVNVPTGDENAAAEPENTEKPKIEWDEPPALDGM